MTPTGVTPPDSTVPRHPKVHAAIEALVDSAQRNASPRTFFSDFVRIASEALGANYGIVEVRLHGHVVTETHASPPSQRDFWAQTAESALSDAISDPGPRARLYRARANEGGVALLSAPLRTGGGSCSGSALLITPFVAGDSIHERLLALEAMTSLAALLTDTLGSAAERPLDDSALDNLRKAAGFTTTTELAFTLTNRLRMRDGCDLVGLAQVRGKKVKILSISGLDEVSSSSPAVRAITAAMEECADFGMPVVHQPEKPLPRSVAARGRLHANWSDSCNGAAVASVPLRLGDRVVAVLAVRRNARAPFDSATLEDYRNLVEPYTASLGLVQRAERTLFAHFIQSTAKLTRGLLSRSGYGKKLRILGPVALCAWLAFGSLSYELSVPCSVAPLSAQQLGAPISGRLTSLNAQPGDRVVEGQLLCRFDASELLLEKQRLQSEIEIQRIAEATALRDGNPVEIQLARANMRQLVASMSLTETRMAATEVTAPADGVLVDGDLRDRVNDVFVKGEPLFEMSATGGWKLELQVPEESIADVRQGLRGRFANLARPEEVHPFEILTVHPSTHSDEGRNYVRVEARVNISDDWVRYGMEGRARVEVGERNAWWVLFHRLENWARLNLWL